MKTTFEKFKGFFDSTEQNPNIDIISSQQGFDEADPEELDEMETDFNEETNLKIPNSLKGLLIFADVSLHWASKLQTPSDLRGIIEVPEIENIFRLDRYRIPMYDTQELDSETKGLVSKAYFFDMGVDYEWGTVLVKDENKDFPDLWFFDEYKFFLMDLNFDNYFDIVFQTKGMFYWQYLFCSREVYQQIDYYKKEYIKNIIDFLPQLFPDDNITLLLERYKAITA